MKDAPCWQCRYCDKEFWYDPVSGKWQPTRTGFCLAADSAANAGGFYNKVYPNTIQEMCGHFEPIDHFHERVSKG